MAYRRKLDEPGVMDQILRGIDARPREYWIAMIEKYDNEKPGDIVLPGVPAKRPIAQARTPASASDASQPASMVAPQKTSRKVGKAA